MKKKIKIILVFTFALLLVGCTNNSKSSVKVSKQEVKENRKGNCIAIECIKQIEPINTVEEINSIIGFEGELTDEKYNKYTWNLTENESVEVTYYSSDKGTIKINIDNDTIKNKKVDFSRYEEISKGLKAGETITYDDFKNKVGGQDGTLIEKSTITNKYTWVAKNNNYLNASFSASSGRCTFVVGRVNQK